MPLPLPINTGDDDGSLTLAQLIASMRAAEGLPVVVKVGR